MVDDESFFDTQYEDAMHHFLRSFRGSGLQEDARRIPHAFVFRSTSSTQVGQEDVLARAKGIVETLDGVKASAYCLPSSLVR